MRHAWAMLLAASAAIAQPLPGTAPLTLSGDAMQQMLDGMRRWLLRATEESRAERKPDRERLRRIIGAVDPRVEFNALELVSDYGDEKQRPSRVRWPVLEGVTAEGLYFEPKGSPVARVIVLPDVGRLPEPVWAGELAAHGNYVLAPMLIDRENTWSGNPVFRMTNQPHREFIYRMAFTVGRHIIGYEVQKVLAAVDWFSKQSPRLPVYVMGSGEGGLIALYAAALDSRIARVTVSGYFGSRQNLWQEPIDRNVWGLLKYFGDAEIAAMIAPRPVAIEVTPGFDWSGPSESDPKRRGAAPGRIITPRFEEVKAEVQRAHRLGAKIELRQIDSRMSDRGVSPDRRKRQFEELVEFTQKLVRRSESVRAQYWSKADASSPAAWDRSIQPQRDHFWNEVIGRLPASTATLNPRSRKSYTGANWDGYEVRLDVHPDVFAYGVLLQPRGIKPGERRPVVVCQHGLNGRPQDLFGQPENEQSPYRYYRNIGDKLASLGFIVYLPQNPYTGDFRQLQRLANPLQLSLFSFIVAQNERALDWLASQPFVDPDRIAFYGLSYGGKTALRIPALLGRYALSICSGDFNEWIVKLTTVDAPYTYMFTQEYEMNEFNLAHVANHAEMALMIAPRPFMVERGHRDNVGVDEWVAYEYAKVRRFYDEMGIGDRTAIEFFNGPHRINGAGTVEFLRRHLRW